MSEERQACEEEEGERGGGREGRRERGEEGERGGGREGRRVQRYKSNEKWVIPHIIRNHVITCPCIYG